MLNKKSVPAHPGPVIATPEISQVVGAPGQGLALGIAFAQLALVVHPSRASTPE
jgi:hypothetical protein